jgi:hypothetical protein
MVTCSRIAAFAVMSGQSVHHLPLQFVGTLNLPLSEELRVLLVVLLAQVKNLLALFHASPVGLPGLGNLLVRQLIVIAQVECQLLFVSLYCPNERNMRMKVSCAASCASSWLTTSRRMCQ